MPGTFTYDEATNTIEVTDGTSGAPATFNDMYTADQAGTATDLLPAEAGTSGPGNSLTYAIRPTHDKAIIIKCIVAAKTAEADFIFITGTDWRGAAQTESLDVTAGNGTYTTTKYWATATDFDCSDNAAGGGVQWADGTIQVTQDIWGVVWEYQADRDYRIDCDRINFGDSATATYFQSKNEQVCFADNTWFLTRAAATLEMGDLAGDWGISGSYWSFNTTTNRTIATTGTTFLMYDSTIHNRGTERFGIFDCTFDGRNSTFSWESPAGNRFVNLFGAGNQAFSLKRMYFNTLDNLRVSNSPDTFENIHVHNTDHSLSFITTPSTADNTLLTTAASAEIRNFSAITATVKDPISNIVTVQNDNANSITVEQYTCNIHIADEDGVDLQTVTVQCQTFGNVVSNDAGSTFYKCIVDHTAGVFATDVAANKWELTTAAFAALAGCTGAAQNGAWVTGIDYVATASEFSVATDSGGDIAEQTIDYKKWIGTSEALLTYSPHTFTLTYGGDTHVINDFTVSSPVVWHLEFPPQATLLSAIVAKLPTNFIMGSSDQADHDSGMAVNVTQISGDSVAADNLESQYDTTGLAGDTFPATQAQIGNIANTAAAANRTPSSYTLTSGNQSSGTVSDTEELDGVNHEHTDNGGVMDLYYEFIIGSGTPDNVIVTGYLNGKNDDLEVYGYDWVSAGWKQIGVLAGKAQSTNEVNSYTVFVNMVGTGADEGKVRVRFTDGAFTLTTATLAIDQIFVSFGLGVEGYDNGAIWINTNVTNTNTVVGIDGTARNPVSTMVAANTLAASTNLDHFEIAPNSSITFAASQENQTFNGEIWTLALGGRSISGTHIIGADVSGICTGATQPRFFHCHFTAATTVPPCDIESSFLASTITAGSAGNFFFEKCQSAVAGTNTPVFDFGSGLNASNLNFRAYSGGIHIQNMGAGSGSYNMSLEGFGQLIINANCSATSTIAIRGHFTITNNASGITLSNEAMFDHNTSIDTIFDKLPDNFIMGSSDGTDKDDEIDAIKASLGQVHTTEDESPGGGGGATTTSGIAEGC